MAGSRWKDENWPDEKLKMTNETIVKNDERNSKSYTKLKVTDEAPNYRRISK